MDDSNDLDFSMIGCKEEEQKKINFSVTSLLSEKEEKVDSMHESTNGKLEQQQIEAEKGSFLMDLEKVEKELSFESKCYDIYNDAADLTNYEIPCLTKSNSLCKKTKDNTKSEVIKPDFRDYAHLIVQFGHSRTSSKTPIGLKKFRRSEQIDNKRPGTVSLGKSSSLKTIHPISTFRNNAVVQHLSKRTIKNTNSNPKYSHSKSKSKSKNKLSKGKLSVVKTEKSLKVSTIYSEYYGYTQDSMNPLRPHYAHETKQICPRKNDTKRNKVLPVKKSCSKSKERIEGYGFRKKKL